MKKAGILGAGVVAQVLGSGLIRHGYQVKLGTRDEGKLNDWKTKEGKSAMTGTMEDAAKFGDLVVLAVKGDAAEKALTLAGHGNLEGKTIIDVTNPISPEPPVNGVLKYFTDMNDSLMERLQRAVPGANFVKAFNSVGNARMVNPDFASGKPTMFICGNDEKAKNEVTEILTLFGWDTEDMGMAEGARAIEPLCILWCIPGFLRNQWMHAFALLK